MKTVSLFEAIKSGKKFRFKMPIWNNFQSSDDRSVFGVDEILYAECQIIEEPREIWVWEYFDGSLSTYCAHKKDECESGTTGRPVKFREVCDE